MLSRKENNEINDEELIKNTDIKKHLCDIARLVGTLSKKDAIKLSGTIKYDMECFIKKLEENVDKIPSNKDIVLEKYEILGMLKNYLYNFIITR